MENNEIMNEGMETVIEEVVMDEPVGIGTGKAMLIVTGLTLAVGAGVVLGKKLYTAYKAKKELRQPDKEVVVEPEDVEEVTLK